MQKLAPQAIFFGSSPEKLNDPVESSRKSQVGNFQNLLIFFRLKVGNLSSRKFEVGNFQNLKSEISDFKSEKKRPDAYHPHIPFAKINYFRYRQTNIRLSGTHGRKERFAQ